MTGEQAEFEAGHEAPSEIERKFLITELDPTLLSDSEGVPIEQGYIRIRNAAETRVRHKGDRHFFTVKSGSGLQRTEREMEIGSEAYSDILPLTAGRQVQKTRYEIPHEQTTIELDIYRGDLAGLAVAEAEFKSLQDAELFTAPDWMQSEVTEDSSYKNQQLALRGWPDEQSPEAAVQEVSLSEGLRALSTYAELLRDTLDRPIVIAVAGGSASGKTTAVASQLAEHFGGQALTISLDDYYKGISYMEKRSAELGRELSFDEPEVVDTELAAAHLQNLRAGETIQKPMYDFKSGESAGLEPLQLGDKSIVIVEGLFALDDNIAEAADITSFVNIETHGRVMRRLLRDLVRTSWTPGQILGYFSTLESMHEQHIQPTMQNADIIINNGYNPAIEAARSDLYETQVKYPAETIDTEELRKHGAELIAAPVTQTDIYYNPRETDLAATDELVRIRQTNESITFGYKGPRSPDENTRHRPKIELPIDEATMAALEYIYPEPIKKVIKERSMFFLDGVIVALDGVKIEDNKHGERELGRFIELRSESTAKIKAASERLGLNPDNVDTRAYFDM